MMALFFPFTRWKPASEVRGCVRKREDDDEQTMSFLDNNVQRYTHERAKHETIIVLTLLNGIMLLLAAILFAVWYYNQYLVKNADLRRASSYSKWFKHPEKKQPLTKR